ncbi:phage tail sheath subtilisin-like domain-containing protein [Novosphingobium sp.]|uniref:phage tail sheath subtilisin-like domain-containing protein n=1 Tax=Novosphingobium sp. TaxID=1874826 RepID=UPI001E129602|nr:phage tail sheath subtilisin-like domain-containing protein [Novosphingobium sp.]MBX9664448.1 phage tail sheath subtilisin-like domain-containing protein [Novosphingobium sp.]
MPDNLNYPGVFVQEIPSGVRTITGVSTSIGFFVGRALKGPLYDPILCQSFEDFERAFTSHYAGGDLARAVRLFFQNGGTRCYVSRIADEMGANTVKAAKVRLLTESKAPSLDLTARSPGALGNDIRIGISYGTDDPEATFNMEVFRWTRSSTGAATKVDCEYHAGLSMDPASPRYAAEILNQQSGLVTAVDSSAAPGGPGFSQSGRPLAATSNAVLRNELIALFGKTASRTSFQFRISVDGGPAQLVDLGKLDFTVAPLLNPATIRTNICTTIAALINAGVSPAVVTASLIKGPSGQTGEKNHKTRLLRIASAKGDVRIFPGPDPATDIAAALMLGTAQGGAEVSRWAASRPDRLSASVTTSGTDIGGSFNQNTRYYSLGGAGGAFQAGAVAGSDGGPPSAADYERAYETADREIDLFNLLVLPKDADHSDATTRALWGPASRFCERRRAFLIMDPPSDWTTAQQAAGPAVGVDTLRSGLVKDHAAVFYPNLRITEAGKDLFVGPSGAIAGLMARIDAARGVWKAPAGTEADLRGVTGVQYRFTDGENGVMNPKGVNTIRVFPNGIVNWGARTMDGDDGFASEYKYIPIRRLALYIQESLYRGVKWVVFEPNDESLWAQIRLNVGAFMNNLFRQGAFQGQSPRDAYFVKCDADTTTQNDRNLGIVNIVVGFAPLKPAEFVVLTLQQIAGQIEA